MEEDSAKVQDLEREIWLLEAADRTQGTASADPVPVRTSTTFPAQKA